MFALLAAVALATKPCPEAPCHGPDCAEIATWVAVGRIADVVHDEQGEPLFKDFAKFAFVPTTWEKGAPADPAARVAFQVGWCDNGMTLPDDTSGEFRFYGANATTDERARYLWFARVGEVRDRRDVAANEGLHVRISGTLRREAAGFEILTSGDVLVSVDGDWSDHVGKAVTVTCTLSGGRGVACTR